MRLIAYWCVAVGLGVLWCPTAWAEQGLANCAAQFPGELAENAPVVGKLSSAKGNVHICRRFGESSFFALEYEPRRYAPRWVAYRVTNTFGDGGCASMTRKEMGCHFQADIVDSCIAGKNDPSDPFHSDGLLAQLLEHG
jgi:hypothetical protein